MPISENRSAPSSPGRHESHPLKHRESRRGRRRHLRRRVARSPEQPSRSMDGARVTSHHPRLAVEERLEARVRIDGRRVILHQSAGVRRRSVVAVEIASEHAQHRHLLAAMMRGVRQPAREHPGSRRRTSKKFVISSHHGSSVWRRRSSRRPLSPAYRFRNSSRVSCAGSGGAATSMPSMFRNHASSLTH